MKRKFSLLFTFLTVAITVHGQHSNFQFKRKVEAITKPGWAAIQLPSDIFKKTDDDYRDLRILKITGSDTTEIPYLLKIFDNVARATSIEFKEINKSKRDGKTFVTFQIPHGHTINHIQFNIAEDNFDGAVTLEGSHDQREWFSITKDQRIVSVDKNSTKFSSTNILIPATNYPYLRATISGKDITFLSASLEEIEAKEGRHERIVQQWRQSDFKQKGKTIIDVKFENKEPVNHLSLGVDQSSRYYRGYSLEALLDSVETEKGYLLRYNTIQSGYLTSDGKKLIDFPLTETQQLKLTIFNEDNAPIKFNDVIATRPAIALVCELEQSQDYFLYYGNASLAAPSYDLVHFLDKVPDSLAFVGIEGEVSIDGVAVQTTTPIFQNMFWIWGIITVMIVVLGFFTLRMIKNNN